MSLSDGEEGSSRVYSFVTFNQDCTSLAVALKSGYKLYSLVEADDQLMVIYENSDENIHIIERLFSSSLIALVSLSFPRKLKVCHFQKGAEICNYSYSSTILDVKLNRSCLVVCLEESLYIHDIRDMKILHIIRDTPANPNGLCALSSCSDNCYLAYPGSSTTGEVQIFDAINLRAKTMITAHDNPLAAMTFDANGIKIATASEKGTVIRIFSVADGMKLYEFRRGMKRNASIYSLMFSNDSEFLCASSNTETVHVFKLEEPKEANSEEESQSWMGYFGKALMHSASYLPSQVTDILYQGRSFATAHLPFSGIKSTCALADIKGKPHVLVASVEGSLYVYSIDPVQGGDCTLVKQYRFNGSDEESHENSIPISDKTVENCINGKRADYPGASSYAAVLKGGDKSPSSVPGHNELPKNCASPSRFGLKLDDDSEFPPMTHKTY